MGDTNQFVKVQRKFMTTTELELLAILSEARAEATLDELRARFTVSQVASPQLA